MQRPQHNFDHAAVERHRYSALGPFRPGFSLIEILVALSIIVLLVGFGVAAMSKFLAQSEVEKTRVLLQQLAGIEIEYRAQTNGRFPDDDPSNSTTTDVDNSIEWFIEQVEALPVTNEMAYKTLNTKFYTATDGAVPGTVVDSWGNPIEYLESSDGTGNFPPYAQPFFASAGPDGVFGDGKDLANPDPDAEDDMYSFDVP